MNRRIGLAAMAALAMAGLVIVLIPQHATSVLRLAAATVTAITAGLVLAAVGPVVAREPTTSALDQLPATVVPPLEPHGLRDARRDIDRPTAPGSVPPSVRRRLVDVLHARGVSDADLPVQLTAVPPAGSGRDPEGVARIVNQVLDAADQGTRHGHH